MRKRSDIFEIRNFNPFYAAYAFNGGLASASRTLNLDAYLFDAVLFGFVSRVLDGLLRRIRGGFFAAFKI